MLSFCITWFEENKIEVPVGVGLDSNILLDVLNNDAALQVKSWRHMLRTILKIPSRLYVQIM